MPLRKAIKYFLHFAVAVLILLYYKKIEESLFSNITVKDAEEAGRIVLYLLLGMLIVTFFGNVSRAPYLYLAGYLIFLTAYNFGIIFALYLILLPFGPFIFITILPISMIITIWNISFNFRRIFSYWERMIKPNSHPSGIANIFILALIALLATFVSMMAYILFMNAMDMFIDLLRTLL